MSKRREEIFKDLSRGKFPEWYGQKITLHTWLFGKEYFWMLDPYGKVYLARVGEDGLPDIS